MEPFTIDAPGLVLSTPTAQDIDKVFLFCQDPQIQRWTTVPSPYTYADAETCTRAPADWRLGFDLKWGIRDPRGTSWACSPCSAVAAATGIGYWMGRPYRARGLMSRAVNAALDAAFDPLGPIGAQRIVWRCDFNGDVPNWASWRVAWHVGFHKQGAPVPASRTMARATTTGWLTCCPTTRAVRPCHGTVRSRTTPPPTSRPRSPPIPSQSAR